MNDDNIVHGDIIDDEHQDLSSSGFRDVALLSLIPQVASELLGMEFDPNDNKNDIHDSHGDEKVNLRILR